MEFEVFSLNDNGLFCSALLYQLNLHTLNYQEELEFTIKGYFQKDVPALSCNTNRKLIDKTGSTAVMVNRSGTPLARLHGYVHDTNALFALCK